MQDRAKAHPKLTVHLNTGVQDAYADAKGNMGGLMLTDSTTGSTLPDSVLVGCESVASF
jgi:hypothetical protein